MAGRTLITAGVLVLLFVVYQLWGTGIREAQAQDRLESRFNERLAQVQDGGDSATVGSSTSSAPPSTDTVTTDTLPPTTAPTVDLAVNEGDPLGQIKIPKIGLDAYVIEGTGDSDLRQGPGHYPGTPMPGQAGNAAIAGHRTTYGAPFANIDELVPGDTITITTIQGTFTYAVIPQPDGSGHIIVNPNQSEVLDNVGDNRLTLTACHPKYSASKRIVVFATLQGEPKPALPSQAKPDAPQQVVSLDLGTETGPKLPVIMFGLLCAAIWIAAWLIGKRWRKWPAYLIGLPFFLVALFYFFENFSRLLPSNF